MQLTYGVTLVSALSACGTADVADLGPGDASKTNGCWDVGALRQGAFDEASRPGFIAVSGGVIVERPVREGAPEREIVYLDAGGEASWSPAESGSLDLMDAKGDEILYQLGLTTELQRARRAEGEPEPVPQSGTAYGWASFDGPIVAWLDAVGHGQGRLNVFDGDAHHTPGNAAVGSVVVSRGRVVWIDGSTIQVWSRGAQEVHSTEPAWVDGVAIGADALFYLADRALYRVPSGGTPSIIADGECELLAGDGDWVAAACFDDTGSSRVYVEAPDGELLEHDLGVGRVGALAISDGRLAFVAYSDPDLCGSGAPTDSGAAYLFDLRTEKLVELGRVIKPCMCCGAYWPPARISLSADAVAWRYPLLGEPGPRGLAGAVAYRAVVSCNEGTAD